VSGRTGEGKISSTKPISNTSWTKYKLTRGGLGSGEETQRNQSTQEIRRRGGKKKEKKTSRILESKGKESMSDQRRGGGT